MRTASGGDPPAVSRDPADVERTADGHHVVIDGRRWRATDPAIPEPDAAVLRRWLMAARRDVGTRKRRGEDTGDARARVHAAKTALGERGTPWWEQTDEERRERWHHGLHLAHDEGFAPSETVPHAGGSA